MDMEAVCKQNNENIAKTMKTLLVFKFFCFYFPYIWFFDSVNFCFILWPSKLIYSESHVHSYFKRRNDKDFKRFPLIRTAPSSFTM